MRLFAGIRPTGEFRTALSLLQERLLSAGVTGRYYDPADLHMTLAFIGEWPDDVTPVLPPVETPFSITLSRPGLFPEAKVYFLRAQLRLRSPDRPEGHAHRRFLPLRR